MNPINQNSKSSQKAHPKSHFKLIHWFWDVWWIFRSEAAEIHPKFTLKMMIGRGPKYPKNSVKLRVWLKKFLKKILHPKKKTDLVLHLQIHPASSAAGRRSVGQWTWPPAAPAPPRNWAPRPAARKARAAPVPAKHPAQWGANRSSWENLFLNQKKRVLVIFWSLGGVFLKFFVAGSVDLLRFVGF